MMPDVAALRRRLPLKITSEPWQCCGSKGITIHKAHGDSMWALEAKCNTCKCGILITKRGVRFEKKRKKAA